MIETECMHFLMMVHILNRFHFCYEFNKHICCCKLVLNQHLIEALHFSVVLKCSLIYLMSVYGYTTITIIHCSFTPALYPLYLSLTLQYIYYHFIELSIFLRCLHNKGLVKKIPKIYDILIQLRLKINGITSYLI